MQRGIAALLCLVAATTSAAELSPDLENSVRSAITIAVENAQIDLVLAKSNLAQAERILLPWQAPGNKRTAYLAIKERRDKAIAAASQEVSLAQSKLDSFQGGWLPRSQVLYDPSRTPLVGDIGFLEGTDATVLQVLDADRMLARIIVDPSGLVGKRRSETVLVQGPTAGMVKGASLINRAGELYGEIFIVRGTYNDDEGSQTVLVIEKVDTDAVANIIRSVLSAKKDKGAPPPRVK